MTNLPTGLEDWAKRPGSAKLLEAVRIRARRGHRTESGTLTSLRLNRAERHDVGLLIGSQWEVSDRAVRLQDLASSLAEFDLTVRHLVELVDGHPIVPDRTLRDAHATAAADETAAVVATLRGCQLDEAVIRTWLAGPGLPARGTGELAAIADEVATVWRRLPTHPETIRLAQLAAQTHNDAHALDADQRLGRAVARLAALISDLEPPQRAGTSWRAAWASVGVRCDGVSSRVLVLNLPVNGDAPAASQCRKAAGEPIWLTLRALSGPWRPIRCVVYVCENLTVVETAADALAAHCPPLVCTDGMPSGAALDLISGLSAAGCSIRYRADFDPAGFVIADQIRGVATSAQPWRFDAATYLSALGIEDQPQDPSHASLRAAYDRHQIVIHEERLLDHLVKDLRSHAADS